MIASCSPKTLSGVCQAAVGSGVVFVEKIHSDGMDKHTGVGKVAIYASWWFSRFFYKPGVPDPAFPWLGCWRLVRVIPAEHHPRSRYGWLATGCIVHVEDIVARRVWRVLHGGLMVVW